MTVTIEGMDNRVSSSNKKQVPAIRAKSDVRHLRFESGHHKKGIKS
jgi:hypothetical protein